MKQKYAVFVAALIAAPTMFSALKVNAENLTAPVTVTGASGNVMTVTPDGKVGIGTTNPLSKLHITVTSPDYERGVTIAEYTSGRAAAPISFLKSDGPESSPTPPNQGDNIGALHARPFGPLDPNNVPWYVATSSLIFTVDAPLGQAEVPTAIGLWTGRSAATRAERLRISSSGNVGIGTTAPETQLQVIKDTTTGGSIVFLDGYEGTGDTNNGPNLAVRQARGTFADPLPTRAGDIVGQVNFRGRGPSGFAPLRRAGVLGYATEAYTDTAQGTMLTLATTANGSTNPVDQVFVTGNGNLGVGISSPNQKLEVDGGLKLNSSSARPACTADSRGTFWVTKGATSDHVSVCLLKQSGAYRWVTLVSGADDEHDNGNVRHKESD